MKIHVRRGSDVVGNNGFKQAIVVFEPNALERFLFKMEEERRLAIQRHGQPWMWQDENKQCPAMVEVELNTLELQS